MPSHPSYFVILGLEEPPADRKAVKRAYSKQLKLTRPDDDPEGFMRLRDAHDMALQILTHKAEDAAWEAAQDQAEVKEEDTTSLPLDTDLTYADLIPDTEGNIAQSETSYAIGPSPSLDAPAQTDIWSEPEVSRELPLRVERLALLASPDRYNDRKSWNALFSEARQLDIDEYVDFENLLLEDILRFHGYFEDDTPHFDQPEKLPQKISPSITASLFKTMNWDQVGNMNYQKAYQIEWLGRRMQISAPKTHDSHVETLPEPNSPNVLGRWFWPGLGALIALALFADLMT